MKPKALLIVFLLLSFHKLGTCQKAPADSIAPLAFFEISPEYSKKRFTAVTTFTGATFTTFSIGLYNVWYKQFEQEGFHLFNDWNEWNNMDKAGHVYTAYVQSSLCYQGAKWTGLSENKSILSGIICGGLFQTTVEVMDGFSSGWGFSIPDFSANIIGLGAFATQQYLWGEQRIRLKISSAPITYSDALILSSTGQSTSLEDRASDLFGQNPLTALLKDYNAQTVWASFNISSFLKDETKFPKWLNIAVGYGSENMFGGFENVWSDDNNGFYDISRDYPRYQQIFISPDIDLTHIKVKNHFLRSLLYGLNSFKIPAPALEITSDGRVIFHFFRIG